MSDPCAFGCTLLNKHAGGCICTADCDLETLGHAERHCKGCLPRPADVGAWCRRHYDRTREQLRRIPELVLNLIVLPEGRIAARSKDGTDASRRATKVDQASPSPAFDLADEAARWAAGWAELHADLLGHAGPFTYDQAGIPNTPLLPLVDYLTGNLPTIAEAGYAMDFATELRTVVRTCELAAGQDRLVHRLRKDRCPACESKSLTREDGSDSTVCNNRACGRVWREGEYATLVRWSTQTGEPEGVAS